MRDVVEETLKEFEDAMRERSIRIERSLGEGPVVKCDRERVVEAVENLISNAMDAMPEGGVLTVATGSDWINGVRHATITVADTGKGIEEGHLNRIFEPFFTTKTSTDRVGLGLSITKRFVEDHGGMSSPSPG
jgi:signal transduction histidine kinase